MDDPHWGWICDGCHAAAADVYVGDGCYLCDDCHERQEREEAAMRRLDEMLGRTFVWRAEWVHGDGRVQYGMAQLRDWVGNMGEDAAVGNKNTPLGDGSLPEG